MSLDFVAYLNAVVLLQVRSVVRATGDQRAINLRLIRLYVIHHHRRVGFMWNKTRGVYQL